MTEITHRTVETNGVRIHLAEAGQGPLVLMCHGFPESWYSWRHQLKALADAGFRAVAPDMRGYGETDRPEEIEKYTLFHLVGDMVGVLDALGEEKAVIVGHDWGAPVAWRAALLRPDRFRGVAGLSVPFLPRSPQPPTRAMPRTDRSQFYMLYFQEPGVAEAEFERDPRHTIRTLLFSGSGDCAAETDRRHARHGSRHGSARRRIPLPTGPPRTCCRLGSPRRTSTSTLTNSLEPAFAVASIGTATWTATGSSWPRSRG